MLFCFGKHHWQCDQFCAFQFFFIDFSLPQVKEAAMKKKLQQFLVEMFKMGTVRGFQHFSMYLRGKEEMGLTVYHEPQVVKYFFFSVSINLFPGYL